MKRYILSCAVFIGFYANAQKHALQFHSINSAGISLGKQGNDLLFQTVNGFYYKTFFAGAGFGIDLYQYNSYPLFLDVRKYFGKDNRVFGYGDGGFNLNAHNKPGNEVYYNSYHFSSGSYFDFGLGYKCRLYKKSFLTFAAGYNYKGIFNKVSYVNECLIAPCAVDYDKYHYGNGKVVLKAGIDF